MRDLFVSIMGKPFGIVVFQLIDATQFTLYLTLIAFAGGGLMGTLIAFLRIVPNIALNRIATVYMFVINNPIQSTYDN